METIDSIVSDEFDLESRFQHLKKATVLLVFDHARAGNGFFKRLFDQHPEVLCPTVIGYLFGKVVGHLGEREYIPGNEALEWILSDGDLKRITLDLTPEIIADIIREGDDPQFRIDRKKVRDILTACLSEKQNVDRKDIITAIFLAYAVGTGRSIDRVKYLLMDAVPHNDKGNASRLNEQLFRAVMKDNAKVVHLVRDPRASFASIRHQYVNQFGNMYPIRSGKVWRVAYCNCVWVWTLRYTTGGSRALDRFRKRLGSASRLFRVVKNEDLNLNFVQTMRELTDWLQVSWYDLWSSPNYAPTSVGSEYKGASAYSAYLTGVNDGPLENDPEDRARFPGPNSEVTRRWERRLLPREIKFLEAVYYEEMRELGYKFRYIEDARTKKRAVLWALLPLAGEIPVTLNWWMGRKRIDKKIAFLIVLPFTYIFSRLTFLVMFYSRGLATR